MPVRFVVNVLLMSAHAPGVFATRKWGSSISLMPSRKKLYKWLTDPTIPLCSLPSYPIIVFPGKLSFYDSLLPPIQLLFLLLFKTLSLAVRLSRSLLCSLSFPQSVTPIQTLGQSPSSCPVWIGWREWNLGQARQRKRRCPRFLQFSLNFRRGEKKNQFSRVISSVGTISAASCNDRMEKYQVVWHHLAPRDTLHHNCHRLESDDRRWRKSQERVDLKSLVHVTMSRRTDRSFDRTLESLCVWQRLSDPTRIPQNSSSPSFWSFVITCPSGCRGQVDSNPPIKPPIIAVSIFAFHPSLLGFHYRVFSSVSQVWFLLLETACQAMTNRNKQMYQIRWMLTYSFCWSLIIIMLLIAF